MFDTLRNEYHDISVLKEKCKERNLPSFYSRNRIIS